VVALGNQFELLPSKDFVQKDRVAREWDVALASWVSEKKLALGKHGLDDYANAMLQIGSMYKQWAAELKESGHPARGEVAAKQAITYFERSMTFGDINNWPKSARLQAIAELQSFLGKSKEAAETFGKIAELPESGVCWLDMKHRQLQVLHAPNSREYRRAVEELLSEFTRQGRKDRYEITLRRSLAEDYQRAGDFKKSNEHLGRIVGEENDPSLDAMTLLLMAENYRGLGVTDLYSTTLKKLVEKYPNTGAGQAAALRIRPGGSP
jgi:tetratricopeptide (TPR) repeat protein